MGLNKKLAEQRKKRQQDQRSRNPVTKIPRARHDKRELLVGRMFDPANQRPMPDGYELIDQSLAGFVPPPFDTDLLWFNPDDPKEFQPDKLLVFFGKRRTGKSFCMRDLLFRGRKNFPYGLVVTNTKFNGYWQHHVPKNYIHELDPLVLHLFIDMQKRLIEKWNEDPWMQKNINPYKFLILDDVVSDTFRYNADVLNAAVQGRHYKVFTMLATQYPRLVATGVRANTDYAFIFFQKTLNEKEAIADEYLNMVPKDEAMAFIAKHTQVEGVQREIVVLDIIKTDPYVTNNIYKHVPVDPGPFIMGCQDFWKDDHRYRELGGPARDPPQMGQPHLQ